MKIKILNLDFEVIEKECIEHGQNLIGQTLHFEQKIYILKSLSDERKKIVLLHEILHSILEQLGFEEKHDDEHLIQSLATAVYQVFKVNQDLLGEK